MLPRGKKKLTTTLWLACRCGEDQENYTDVDSPENLDLIFAYRQHLGDPSPSSAARCKGQSSGGRIMISESDAIYDLKTICVSSRVCVCCQAALDCRSSFWRRPQIKRSTGKEIQRCLIERAAAVRLGYRTRPLRCGCRRGERVHMCANGIRPAVLYV